MYDPPSMPRPSAADRFSPAYPSLDARRATGSNEHLTAWEPWEMSSITEQLSPVPGSAKAGVAPLLKPLAPALLIDEAELAGLRLQAQQAGETEGHQQGYAQGQAEGYAAAMTAVHEQAEHLRALALTLPAALRSAEREVADDLLALALAIARQVLGQALTADPQIILAVVRELLQVEPTLTGTPQLVLHPDDAALVKEHLADDLQAAGWRVRADASNKRGGCRVMATSGERDATLDARWERVTATLARNAPATASVVHD